MQHTILSWKFLTKENLHKQHLIIHLKLILKILWDFIKNIVKNHIHFYCKKEKKNILWTRWWFWWIYWYYTYPTTRRWRRRGRRRKGIKNIDSKQTLIQTFNTVSKNKSWKQFMKTKKWNKANTTSFLSA